MVEYLVRQAKPTRIKVDPKELMRKSLLQIAHEKVNGVTEEQISFDGTYLVIEPQWMTISIGERDLIDHSARSLIKKELGLKGQLEIVPGKRKTKK